MDVTTLFLAIVLLVLAWAAAQYLPSPIGIIVCVVLALLALWFLISAFDLADGDEHHDVDLLVPYPALVWLKSRLFTRRT